MHLLRRGALLAAGAAGAVVGSRWVGVRRTRFAKVAPDLRSPVLYVVPSITNDRALRVVQRLIEMVPMPLPAGVERRTIDGGIDVLLYEPAARERPSGVLVWIHGGGMVMGRPEQGNAVCAQLAEAAGALVVSVEYRLAPEHPFPAGPDDCYSALRWVHREAGALGIDPARIAVGGDSAGGGLTAAVCQMALDRGEVPVAFQLLVYPMIDDRTVLRTDLDPDGVYLWSPASNRYGWTAYLGHAPTADAPPPYAAPSRRDDLSGLPPAWLGVGDLDLFYDEDVEYARRLEAAGVPCELHVASGMWHGADSVLTNAETSKRFRASMADALTAAIGATPPTS